MPMVTWQPESAREAPRELQHCLGGSNHERFLGKRHRGGEHRGNLRKAAWVGMNDILHP